MKPEPNGRLFVWLRNAVATIVILVALLFASGYFLSVVSWYGSGSWIDRVSTDSIGEATTRGVLIKELKYRMIGFTDTVADFHAYIERGFRYGVHSSGKTRLVADSRFPYQLNFSAHPDENITVTIRPDNLVKFDSASDSRGFLQAPVLKDTIELDVHEDDADTGKIIVWN